MPETVLYEQEGAQLVERSFVKDSNLIKLVVDEVNPLLEKKPKVFVYGEWRHQQRNVGFFSDESYGYFFSGQCARAQKLSPALKTLLAAINDDYGAEFNGMLINHYENGTNKISAHADDETALDANVGVVTLSYGAERTFRVRQKVPKKAGPVVCDATTKDCVALQMRGPRFQKDLTHEVPEQRRVLRERFSITFRRHDPKLEAPLIKAYEASQQRKRPREE
jgi:alkylated DNA repair dioxygenase AlkB